MKSSVIAKASEPSLHFSNSLSNLYPPVPRPTSPSALQCQMSKVGIAVNPKPCPSGEAAAGCCCCCLKGWLGDFQPVTSPIETSKQLPPEVAIAALMAPTVRWQSEHQSAVCSGGGEEG